MVREAEPVVGAGQEAETALPRSRGETVLVVEDEAAVLGLARKMLEGLGYVVLSAGTPAEATRVGGEHPDEIELLMTDVILPGMNGRDFARQMRASRPAMKCLFMSGYTAEVVASRGTLDEGGEFIAKPFSKRDLAAKIRTVLDARE